MNDLIALFVALAVSFAAAGLGSIATSRSLRTWYVDLRKPAWNPPSWLFGPVWTLLYLAMAVASWRVWLQRDAADVAPVLALFAAQLLLNVAWSWVFFAFRDPARAFGTIVVLWALIALTVIAFARIDPIAGWLLVPYLAWVTFASALNFAVAKLNPAS